MKILIVYAKAGAGHLRAAQAIYNAFKRKGQAQDVMLVDCLDYTNPWFKYFYPNSYLFLVRFLPLVWAGIYYGLENRLFYSLIKPFRRFHNWLASQKFARFLIKERPEVIISTQFFASEVVAALKKEKKIDSTLISVVTDFGAHTFWESEDVDIFVAASEDTKLDLISRNIPKEKIKVLGIPIDSPLREFNREALSKEIGLNSGLFTVLVVGGGFGVGPIKELVLGLNKLSEEIKPKAQVVVVCSRNEKLYKEMKDAASKLKIHSQVFGFVADLYKMMVTSDVIISKSGGLTASESLACGLPMIIISPIPGQETKNCDLLVKNGAAVRIDRASQAREVIEELVKQPEKLERMRKVALTLARPDSADDIAALAQSYVKK